MALASATITFDIADMVGTDFDVRRGIRIWLDTNVPNDTVVDTTGNKIRIGGGKVTINADGTGSFDTWIPGAGSNPASWQTSVHVEYVDEAKRRKTRTFGPFTITASGDLADLIQEQEVPPTYLSAITDQLDAIVDSAAADLGGYVTSAQSAASAAAASATEAQSVAGIDTPDALVAALIPTASGSSTSAALTATYAPPAIPLPPATGGDDYAALQAVLTAHAGKRIAGHPGAAYKISNTLVLGSGTTLDLTGCSVTITVNNKRMIQNSALGGAGARNTDINLIGGYWDRSIGGGGVDGNQGHSIVFHRADRVTVTGVRFKGLGTIKYAIYLVDVTRARVEKCDLDSTSDGVHITGPATDITVRDIAGDTHDDLVSFTGRDYVTYEMTAGGGSITNILVERITLRSGDGNTVKLLPGAAKTLTGAVVRNVSGAPNDSAVIIYSDAVDAATTGGTVRDVVIDGVTGAPVNGFMVNVAHPDVQGLQIRNVAIGNPAMVRAIALSTSGGTIKRVSIDGVTSVAAFTGAVCHVGTGMTVETLSISNVAIEHAIVGQGHVVTLSGSVGALLLSNISQILGRSTVDVPTGPCPLLVIRGLHCTGQYGLFLNAGVTVEMQVNGVTSVPTSRLAYTNHATGNVVLRASGITGAATSHIGRTSTGTLRAVGAEIRADVSTLTPTAGDIATNTNASLTCGTGPVIYDTTWRNLATGAHTTASPSWDIPSIAAGGQQEVTTSATGAALGDNVRATPPAALEAGLVWHAYVSASNTVTLRVTNITAAPINPATATWKLFVGK